MLLKQVFSQSTPLSLQICSWEQLVLSVRVGSLTLLVQVVLSGAPSLFLVTGMVLLNTDLGNLLGTGQRKKDKNTLCSSKVAQLGISADE